MPALKSDPSQKSETPEQEPAPAGDTLNDFVTSETLLPETQAERFPEPPDQDTEMYDPELHGPLPAVEKTVRQVIPTLLSEGTSSRPVYETNEEVTQTPRFSLAMALFNNRNLVAKARSQDHRTFISGPYVADAISNHSGLESRYDRCDGMPLSYFATALVVGARCGLDTMEVFLHFPQAFLVSITGLSVAFVDPERELFFKMLKQESRTDFNSALLQRTEREIEMKQRMGYFQEQLPENMGVIEYVIPGCDLTDIMEAENNHKESRVFELSQAIALILDLIEGDLAHAHANKIVHRDLKPDNVRYHKGEKRLKLIDYGISRMMDMVGEAKLTKTGVVLGTPTHMAPEQIAGRSEDITPATDIYAIGIILYQLVSGRLPYRGTTLAELLTAHLMGTIDKTEGLDNDFFEIITKCMARESGDRFQNAAELSEALRTYAAQNAISIPTLESFVTVPEKKSSRQSIFQSLELVLPDEVESTLTEYEKALIVRNRETDYLLLVYGYLLAKVPELQKDIPVVIGEKYDPPRAFTYDFESDEPITGLNMKLRCLREGRVTRYITVDGVQVPVMHYGKNAWLGSPEHKLHPENPEKISKVVGDFIADAPARHRAKNVSEQRAELISREMSLQEFLSKFVQSDFPELYQHIEHILYLLERTMPGAAAELQAASMHDLFDTYISPSATSDTSSMPAAIGPSISLFGRTLSLPSFFANNSAVNTDEPFDRDSLDYLHEVFPQFWEQLRFLIRQVQEKRFPLQRHTSLLSDRSYGQAAHFHRDCLQPLLLHTLNKLGKDSRCMPHMLEAVVYASTHINQYQDDLTPGIKDVLDKKAPEYFPEEATEVAPFYESVQLPEKHMREVLGLFYLFPQFFSPESFRYASSIDEAMFQESIEALRTNHFVRGFGALLSLTPDGYRYAQDNIDAEMLSQLQAGMLQYFIAGEQWFYANEILVSADDPVSLLSFLGTEVSLFADAFSEVPLAGISLSRQEQMLALLLDQNISLDSALRRKLSAARIFVLQKLNNKELMQECLTTYFETFTGYLRSPAFRDEHLELFDMYLSLLTSQREWKKITAFIQKYQRYFPSTSFSGDRPEVLILEDLPAQVVSRLQELITEHVPDYQLDPMVASAIAQSLPCDDVPEFVLWQDIHAARALLHAASDSSGSSETLNAQLLIKACELRIKYHDHVVDKAHPQIRARFYMDLQRLLLDGNKMYDPESSEGIALFNDAIAIGQKGFESLSEEDDKLLPATIAINNGHSLRNLKKNIEALQWYRKAEELCNDDRVAAVATLDSSNIIDRQRKKFVATRDREAAAFLYDAIALSAQYGRIPPSLEDRYPTVRGLLDCARSQDLDDRQMREIDYFLLSLSFVSNEYSISRVQENGYVFEHMVSLANCIDAQFNIAKMMRQDFESNRDRVTYDEHLYDVVDRLADMLMQADHIFMESFAENHRKISPLPAILVKALVHDRFEIFRLMREVIMLIEHENPELAEPLQRKREHLQETVLGYQPFIQNLKSLITRYGETGFLKADKELEDQTFYEWYVGRFDTLKRDMKEATIVDTLSDVRIAA